MPKAGDKINENWRLYGRSTSDDKAPIIALLAAIDALQNSEIAFTSNIKLFFDGEEEMGSPHVMDYFTNYNSLFEDIDVWLMVDGPVFLTGQPVLNFGSRGITGMELTVYGATRPLHSGHYGNYAPVPGQMLAALLATMKDEKGKVLIEGYYDTVEPISDFEREQINKIPKIDEQIRVDLGIAQPEGDGETIYERLLLPSLTIRGLSSGNVGALARNVIPNIAVATLGMRLVKGNDPEQMMNLVEAHIKKQGWHIVYDEPDMETRMNYPRIIKVEREKDGGPASKISMNHPAVLPVIESIKSFTGDNLVLIPSSGGSNNAKVAVLDGIKMPGISISIANHDNNQHAENENIRIGNLWYGIDLMGVLLTMPEPKTELKKK
jgi:acetylornithine deacetylase/succinyl-diaminopimelate desuccinylase-like protein